MIGKRKPKKSAEPPGEVPKPKSFQSLEAAEKKAKVRKGRIRGRMKKIGAPVNEVAPRKKAKKQPKGKHRGEKKKKS